MHIPPHISTHTHTHTRTKRPLRERLPQSRLIWSDQTFTMEALTVYSNPVLIWYYCTHDAMSNDLFMRHELIHFIYVNKKIKEQKLGPKNKSYPQFYTVQYVSPHTCGLSLGVFAYIYRKCSTITLVRRATQNYMYILHTV